MKVIGWILCVFALLNYFVGILLTDTGVDVSTHFNAAVLLGLIGGYCLYRANKKEEEEKERKRWERGSNKESKE